MKPEIYDAAVYGGTFTGVSAAIRLLSEGKKVVLIEPRPTMGAEAAYCMELDISQAADSKSFSMLRKDLEEAGAVRNNRTDSAITEIRVHKLLEKADILYYSHPVGLMRQGNAASKLVMQGKYGLFPICAKTFLDCSENLALFSFAPGAEIHKGESEDKLFVFALECGENVKCPNKISEDILIRPSIWDTERIVEFKGNSRMMVPEVLKKVKSEVPELRDAMLTHMSMEPLKLSSMRVAERGSMENLFAVEEPEDFTFELRAGLISKRMREGELLAEKVIGSFGSLPKIELRKDEPLVAVSPAEEISCDVLVCGGGTAGALAAIAAGRQGAGVILWEALSFLGGVGSGGAIHAYYHGVAGGIQDEVDSRVKELEKLFNGKEGVACFHHEAKKIVLEQMATEAGVKIEFGRNVCGIETSLAEMRSNLPVRKGDSSVMRKIDTVSSCADNGMVRCRAKTVVDSTGDADIAAMAGVRHSVGREPDAAQHLYSLPATYLHNREEKNDKGEVVSSRLIMTSFNIDIGYCDALDPWDVSAGRVKGIRFYDNTKGPFHKSGRIINLSSIVGVRASRQIFGDVRIKLADQLQSREFQDVVGYAYAHYDNHAKDYENESDEAMLWVWAFESWYARIGSEIPYRSLIPEGIENLLVACRSLSLDYDAQQQFRMQRDMQRIGEAAGTAAAIASKNSLPTRAIDIAELQRKLAGTKALLSPETNYHTDAWKPIDYYPPKRTFELGDGSFVPAKLLTEGKDNGIQKLEASLDNTQDKQGRYSAALKLASAGLCVEKSLAILEECLRERCEELPSKAKLHRTAPVWKIAIGVFGALRHHNARNLVEDVLKDKNADLGALTLAVRTLGRIGDAESADKIDAMLKRTDIPKMMEFPKWMGDGKSIFEDVLWKLELAAAESLKNLGRDRMDIVRKYMEDERAYVRRAAERVMSRMI